MIEAPGVFVTGTDTEVGKSRVAAAIARELKLQGHLVGVFKPAVSGMDEPPHDAPFDHQLLRLAAGSNQADEEIAPYRFGPAVSPHLAADMASIEIEPALLVEAAERASTGRERLVCEGVGGFLVPLSDDYLVRDLAVDLGLPVVIAARPGLGTINHTLLTLAAVRAARLEVAYVVITPWPDEPNAMELSNRATIERLGEVEVRTLAFYGLGSDTWPSPIP